MESFLERIRRVEECLGLMPLSPLDHLLLDDNQKYNSKESDFSDLPLFEVVPLLRKQLRNAGYGFALEEDFEHLNRLKKTAFMDIEEPTTEEKITSILQYAAPVIPHAGTITGLKENMDSVLNSNELEKVATLEADLERGESEVKESDEMIMRFENELIEFYKEFLVLLNQIHDKLDAME